MERRHPPVLSLREPMAQFDVHRNLNPASKSVAPFIVDLQSDLVSHLPTRLVAPLKQQRTIGGRIEILMPEVDLQGKKFIVSLPEMAGVPLTFVGPAVGSLSRHRDQFVAGIDLLIAGF